MLRDSDGTIQILGHDEVLKSILSSGLTNTLIVGPSSVGKRSMLEKLIQTSGVSDVIRVYDLREVSMDEVREASRVGTGDVRVIFMRLNRLRRLDAEKLLKTIEDAPQGTVFLATADSNSVPATVQSRFTKYEVGYLTSPEVATILTRIGYAPDKAVELAELNLNAINPTIYLGKTASYITLVNRALKSIEDHDEDTLDSLYGKWEDGHTRTLLTWARERITGRWRVFQETDFPTLGKGVALRILQKVDTANRPRYVVRAELVSIIREDQQ